MFNKSKKIFEPEKICYKNRLGELVLEFEGH